MKASLEDITPVKKKLLIEIESQEVDKKLNKAYGELRKNARIPGFRPGKVPRKILETHFGPQVAEDVTRVLINETFPKAIQEVETFPVGAPLLEKEILKQGQGFKYTAVMEVRPKFELMNYLGLEVKKEKGSVTEEDVQDQLEQIRKANGTLSSIEQDRPIKRDDYVVLEYDGFENEVPLEGIKATNYLLRVGSQEFHPKFEEALIGLNKQDETEIKVDFKESYYHEKLAGKSVNFKVKIIDIKEMVLAELNDEFAGNLGADLKNLEELKTKVREVFTAQEEKRIKRELNQRLLQQISDSVDFELPQSLVESEIHFAVENVKQNLIRNGSSIEKAGLSEEKLKKDFRPASEKRVKEILILGEIAKNEDIEVSEEDLMEGFKELASTTGQDVETLKGYYEARNLVDSLKEKLLEEKALNYLVEHAKILEVDKDVLGENKST